MRYRDSLAALFLLTLCGLALTTALTPAQGARRVLTANDLRLIGGFRLPPEVTAYGMPGISVRHVGSGTHLFVSGHRLSWDPVFEVRVPDSFPFDPLDGPRATTVARWGSGAKDVLSPLEWEDLRETRGLQWHDGRLYFVYQQYYNTMRLHNPSVGRIDFPGAKVEPWFTDAHSHLTGGFIVEIPEWYANAYTRGRRLAVGSPLVSGNVFSSWGPNLRAMETPTGPGILDTFELIEFSFDERSPRPYTYEERGFPDIPGGWWTQTDFLHGATWVDTGTLHGVVFAGALADGEVWYGGNDGDACAVALGGWQGTHAEAYTPYWWIYDPMSFTPVSGADPSSITPSSLFRVDLENGCLGRHGLTYDPVGQRLYVLAMEGDHTTAPEPLPLVYVFEVGENVGDGVASWPFSPAPGVPVTIEAPACPRVCAEWVSVDTPAELPRGASASATLVLRNTGTTIWEEPDDGVYHGRTRIGSQAPADNVIWGTGRWEFADGVAPGETVTIHLSLRAPATPGTYPFEVRLLRELVGWFGPASPPRTIVVR